MWCRVGSPEPKARQAEQHGNIYTTMIYLHEQDRPSNPSEAFIDYGEKLLMFLDLLINTCHNRTAKGR